MADESCSTQLIDGDGEFNVDGLNKFVKTMELAGCGLSYAVVAIMGPQSSGKSTLLNHLFHTNFKEMDAFKGRSQTTKGIWMARCRDIEPCTVVMDLEGSDGRVRGEDDTTFEEQSVLFALSVSDIVLINMWCHDIGREQAANKPLLKTVFQAMLWLFGPRKTTLMFVIRDKTRTPFEYLEPILRDDIQKIWDSVPKPQAHKETPLSEFFIVGVVALDSYEEKEEQFKEQVANLKQRIFHSIAPDGLAGDRHGVVPASAFSFSAQQIWKVIKENKDLDLPAHKVLVATFRCEEIANQCHSSFSSLEEWCQLEKAVQTSIVPGFGKKLSAILDKYLSSYDMEVVYFEDNVKNAKRQQLEFRLLQLVHPAYRSMVRNLRSKILDEFKDALSSVLESSARFTDAIHNCTQSSIAEYDDGCKDATIQRANWDTSKSRDKLRCDIDTHIASVHAAKLLELTSLFERQLDKALADPVGALLDEASDNTWLAIRNLLQRETQAATSALFSSLSAFGIDDTTTKNMMSQLEHYAINVVRSKAAEESGRILITMKDRFATLFSCDSDSMPRVWTGKEDIRAITITARFACLKMLSVMAATCLDEDNDHILNTLSLALVGSSDNTSTSRSIRSVDPLALSSWEAVPLEDILITPARCKVLWRQFITETEYTVTQALVAQFYREASRRRRNNSALPPPWAIAATLLLGFSLAYRKWDR